MKLTGPVGMPRAILSSSDRSPGFFSFSRVSNSLPWETKPKMEPHESCKGTKTEKGERETDGERNYAIYTHFLWKHFWEKRRCYLNSKTRAELMLPHSTDLHGWWALAWSATWRRHHGASGSRCQSCPSLGELSLAFCSSWFLHPPVEGEKHLAIATY